MRREERGERREEGGEGGQIPSTNTSYSQKVIDSTDLLGHNEAGESLDVPHQQEHSDIWIFSCVSNENRLREGK